MSENDRRRIEFLLGLRWPVSEIAADQGRPDSTIQREILTRSGKKTCFQLMDGDKPI